MLCCNSDTCELGLGGMHWQALAIVDGRTITHSFIKSLALSNFSDVPIMYVLHIYFFYLVMYLCMLCKA